jgi:hypothetical protein
MSLMNCYFKIQFRKNTQCRNIIYLRVVATLKETYRKDQKKTLMYNIKNKKF